MLKDICGSELDDRRPAGFDGHGRRWFGVRGRGRIRQFGITALVKGKVDIGSIAAEDVASVAGSIHPSLDGAIGSDLRVGAVAGAISQTMSDSRAKSCASGLFGAPDMGSNPSKIKSPRMSAV